MKIKVISAHQERQEAISKALGRLGNAADLSGATGNPEELQTVINGSAPDLVVIDGAPGRTLEAIELLCLQRPGVDAIILSNNASPEFFLRAMRAGVREVVPATATADLLPSVVERLIARRAAKAQPVRAKVFAFTSCKGGSGASFLAANFAYVLAAEQGARVALIDLKLQFGDAALLLSERRPPSNVAELAQQCHRLDASLLTASMLEVLPNLSVLAAPEDPSQAGTVRPEHVEAIVRQARGQYDAVVLDLGPALGPVSLQALDMADTILPVLQLSLPFVRCARHQMQVFRSLEYPDNKLRPIVNRYEKGGDIALSDLETAIGRPVFKTVPNSHAAVTHSVNLGEAIIKNAPNGPVSKALRDLGHALLPAEARQSERGWVARMLGRR